MHVAADEGQTVVHAHLEINHPEVEEKTQMWRKEVRFNPGSKDWPLLIGPS